MSRVETTTALQVSSQGTLPVARSLISPPVGVQSSSSTVSRPPNQLCGRTVSGGHRIFSASSHDSHDRLRLVYPIGCMSSPVITTRLTIKQICIFPTSVCICTTVLPLHTHSFLASAFQSFMLVSGYSTEVGYWTHLFPLLTWCTARNVLNPMGRKAWWQNGWTGGKWCLGIQYP